MTTTAIVLSAAGVLLTAAVTYLIARRATSGRVDTTEAVTLWKESSDMRDELRNEVVAYRAEVVVVRKRMDEIQRLCDDEIRNLQRRIVQLEERLP